MIMICPKIYVSTNSRYGGQNTESLRKWLSKKGILAHFDCSSIILIDSDSCIYTVAYYIVILFQIIGLLDVFTATTTFDEFNDV